MITIVGYILKVHTVYALVWFEIKSTSLSRSGAFHLFKTIERTRMLRPDVNNIAFPVSQRNAYYAHPENILICMINDESEHIRELGWKRIKKA